MIVSTSWISENYDKYNKMCFNNELPKIAFKVSRAKHRFGYASYRVDTYNKCLKPLDITISNYYDSPEYVKLNTLLHEMIHIYDYVKNPDRFYDFVHHHFRSSKIQDAHGMFFLSEANRLRDFGFDVNTHVTNEEIKASTLSRKSTTRQLVHKNEGRLILLKSKKKAIVFKTCTPRLAEAMKTCYSIDWRRYLAGPITDVQVYKFDSAYLAEKRSCISKIKARIFSNHDDMKKYLKYYNCKLDTILNKKYTVNKFEYNMAA